MKKKPTYQQHGKLRLSIVLLIFLFSTLFAKARNNLTDKIDHGPANSFSTSSSSLHFTENKGQITDQHDRSRSDVIYGGTDGPLSFHIRKNGISYQLSKRTIETNTKPPTNNIRNAPLDQLGSSHEETTLYRVDLNWPGSNPNVTITTDKTLPGYSNYYRSENQHGVVQVKSYEGITLHNLYDHINLHYYEHKGHLKYDYIVAAGADYHQIQVEVNGAAVYAKSDGSILLQTPLGKIEESKPTVFQKGKELKARWVVAQNKLSYEIENYDPTVELIIDPGVRLWGTYYGSVSPTQSYGTCTDAFGNVYFTGQTSDPYVIATTGSHQNTIGGNDDAFIVKLDPTGVRQWATYYGGANFEIAFSCVTDAIGNVYMAGATASSTGIATLGSHQTIIANKVDAFLVKFNSSGTRQWGTYYGGLGAEVIYTCETDLQGNVIIAGQTNSSGAIATVGSHQLVYGGMDDAFVVKFDANGVRQWGTYYGGTSTDRWHSCATDAMGNIFLAGHTHSTNASLVTAGCYQNTAAGGSDALLVKLNANGVRQWGTFFGDGHIDIGYGCSTDPLGNVFMCGLTFTSSSSTVLASAGSHQSSTGGLYDAYLVKFDGNGARLWGTYYGGSGEDKGYSCATDAAGNVYMAGESSSTDNFIATTNGHQTVLGGVIDAFLVYFNAAGIRQWGTLYGDIGHSYGRSCCTDDFGNVFLNGDTYSEGTAAMATPGSHQPMHGGGPNGSWNAFVAKFEGCLPVTAQINIVNPINCNGGNDGSATCVATGGSNLSYSWLPSGGNSATATGLTAGTYTCIVSNGCGNTATATVQITEPSIHVDTLYATNCCAHLWACNGETYTESGVYTCTSYDQNGCMQLNVLNLTIFYETWEFTDVTVTSSMTSYTWAANGVTYYPTFQNQEIITTNQTGCQHHHLLRFDQNNVSNITSCGPYTWACNNQTYSQGGNYTHTKYCMPDICAAGALTKGCISGDEYILNCKIGSINNTSGCANGIQYEDYTALATMVSPNENYQISITNDNDFNGDQITVWTDWNGDNDYDDPFEVTSIPYVFSGFTGGLNISTGTIHVPSYAVNGNTRMRVRLNYVGTMEPCGNTMFGEVEDYTLLVNTTPDCACVDTCYLNLTVFSNISDWYTVSTCDAYTSSLNGTTYTSSGTYALTYINSNGCPQTDTLDLTIFNSPVVTAPNINSCSNVVTLGGSPAGGIWNLPNPYSGNATSYSYYYTDANGCTQSAMGSISTMTATITNLQVNFITGISAIASWNAVNGVGWYEIRYKPITSSIWITATSGSVSSKLLINLIPNTSYEIQVRGFCSTTNPGAWSSTVTFTTNSQCGVPSGLQLSAQTATTATLNWNSTGAGFYTVRWKNVTQSTWLAATTTTLTKLVTGLTAGQTYEFQVKSHCGNSASSYSSSFVFTAGALPRQASSSGITSDAFIPIYIYPNPTLDELNIDFEATQREQITLKIIDPSGRIIRQVLEESTIGKNHFLLDVHTIANGIYLIELFSNDKLLSIERFIKN